MVQTQSPRRCPTCHAVVTRSVGGQCPRCMVRVLQGLQANEGVWKNNRPVYRNGNALGAHGMPRMFGDYELLDEVGRGGMGVVYRARQFSLNRQVAVKLVAPEYLSSPKAVERFRAEAEATASLDHPNIVPIFETGEVEGWHYFSMKLVEGRTLAQALKSPASAEEPRRLSYREAAALLVKIADAVHYAHQRGILHRDLKPGNILIDGSGEPHVTDFGLAKNFGPERSVSVPGEVLGTPAYMAPEQAVGKVRPTTAADVYSLGAILYEALTGAPPFQGDTSLEVLEAALHQEPAPARSRRRDVPQDLETIALRCLQKEPSKRYGSAQALADDLRRYLNGEPILARPITTFERFSSWRRRNTALASALLGVALACIAGLAGVLWQWHRASLNANEARQKELDARANLYAADMNLVRQALEADNLRQALDLLRRHVPAPGEPDLRGFEWRYFWRQSRSDELFSVAGHARSAICAAFSPDSRILITGGFDRKALVWDLSSRRLLKALPHPDQVQSVAFSPNGNLFATGSDSTVQLWDSGTYQHLLTLDRAAGKVGFSPDGNYLVTTSLDGLMLWRTSDWTALKTLPYSDLQEPSWDGVGFGIAFSPDSTHLALAADDGIRLFGLPDLEESGRFLERIPRLCFIAFSPDGRTLAASTRRHAVKTWDLATGRELHSWEAHSDSIFAGEFSPDSRSLATGSADQTLKLWDASTGELIRTYRGHADELWDITFSPDGTLLASVGKDGTVKIWDAREKPSGDPILRNVDPLGFSSDGTLLAVADNELLAYDPASGRRISSQSFLGLGPRRQFLSYLGNLFSDGRTAVLFDPAEKKMEIWDLKRKRPLCTVESVDKHASFAPGRQLLATATAGNTVTVWQMPTGLRKWSIPDSSTVFALSPDGGVLATSDDSDDSFRLWRLEDDSAHQFMTVHGDGEHQGSLAFSPDGRTLAVGMWEGVIRLFELPDGRQSGVLVGHKRAVISLAFSPDGRTLATVSDDSTIRLWHVATQREVAKFQELGDPMAGYSVSFSPDGRALAVERIHSDEDITRVWFAPSLAEIAGREAR